MNLEKEFTLAVQNHKVNYVANYIFNDLMKRTIERERGKVSLPMPVVKEHVLKISFDKAEELQVREEQFFNFIYEKALIEFADLDV